MKRIVRVPGRHPVATTVVGLGVLLRLAMMIAYSPALWYDGDSGQYVIFAKMWPGMGFRWPYAWFLKAWEWTGTFVTVAFLQHLAIVLVAVAIYAFLRRQGLGQWLSAAAILPLMLDARQLMLEQYLLTETLFTTLLSAAVLMVVWRTEPHPLVLALAGVAAAVGWATRATGIVAIVTIVMFLLLRHRSLRQAAAFLLGAVALLWAASWQAGGLQKALTMDDSAFLYARTVQVADCDRLRIRDELRPLCPPQPLGQRPERPDWYLWDPESPIHYAREQQKPELLGEFARAVLTQQTGDYLARIASDSASFFVPTNLGPTQECLAKWWRPHYYPANWMLDRGCVPHIAGEGYRVDPQPSSTEAPTALSKALKTYGGYGVLPPWALSLAVVVAIAGAVWRRRDPVLRLLTLQYLTIGLGIMLLSVATAMYDPRFGVPSLAFLPVAAALGWHRIRMGQAQPRSEEDRLRAGDEPRGEVVAAQRE